MSTKPPSVVPEVEAEVEALAVVGVAIAAAVVVVDTAAEEGMAGAEVAATVSSINPSSYQDLTYQAKVEEEVMTAKVEEVDMTVKVEAAVSFPFSLLSLSPKNVDPYRLWRRWSIL